MKVGDLVRFRSTVVSRDFIGLVTAVGQWTGNADVKVLWNDHPEPVTQKSGHLKKVISESR